MKSTPLRVKSSKRTRKLTTDLQENESAPAEPSAGALCHCGTVREPQTPDRSPKEIRRMEWERARNCQGVFKITPVGKHRKSPRRRPASRSPGLRVPAETERAVRQGSRPLRPDPRRPAGVSPGGGSKTAPPSLRTAERFVASALRMFQTSPCSIMAWATFKKPAMFAPATRLYPNPYSSAAFAEASWILHMISFSFLSTSFGVQL